MKKPAQQPPAAGKGDEWLATYCDMVTLLFVFFVLLFAISQVDVQKFNLLAASLSNKGASPEEIMKLGLQNKDEFEIDDAKIPLTPSEEDDANPLQDTYDSINELISQSGMEDKVMIFLGDDYIFIRFMDEMLFNPNSAVIRPEDYEFLRFIGNSLKSVQNNVGMIRIDGHTASVPGQEDYHISDRELSSARANAVLKYFEETVGIRGDKLTSFAFGKYRPLESNDTEAGRQKNRRIEILVTEANGIAMQLDNIYEKITS